jgi:hypothetical protein
LCIRTNSQFKKGEGYWTGKKRKPFSDDWKNKIAQANMGNNYGKALKGIKRSEETKKKMSLARVGNKIWLGKNHSLESRKKCSITKMGNKNPNWRGGRKQKRKVNSFIYREWRKKILVRDGFVCQICQVVGGKLNVHHIKDWKNFKNLRYKIDNGITLCVACHKSMHKKYGK